MHIFGSQPCIVRLPVAQLCNEEGWLGSLLPRFGSKSLISLALNAQRIHKSTIVLAPPHSPAHADLTWLAARCTACAQLFIAAACPFESLSTSRGGKGLGLVGAGMSLRSVKMSSEHDGTFSGGEDEEAWEDGSDSYMEDSYSEDSDHHSGHGNDGGEPSTSARPEWDVLDTTAITRLQVRMRTMLTRALPPAPGSGIGLGVQGERRTCLGLAPACSAL